MSPSADRPLLRLFVYGTLKRGYHNHAGYCRDVVAVETASTLGRLYLLPQGYPMLVVPQAHQLALGTTDYLSDVAIQARLAAQWSPSPVNFADNQEGDWEQIAGEVLSFDDPEARLPELDRLEDFQPEGRSLYHRALVAVHALEIEPVWTYIAPGGQPPPEARRIGRVWPE